MNRRQESLLYKLRRARIKLDNAFAGRRFRRAHMARMKAAGSRCG